MAGYITPVSVHYTQQNASTSDSNRIAPAPTISITPEIYYANDNPIGYTYNISIKGFANALRKELDSGSTNFGLQPVLQHMGDIRKIFSFNGGDLHIKQTNGDTILAKGATIKSITFDQSDNKWINYAPFTIEIEFNELNLTGCAETGTIDCSNSIFHQVSGAVNINNNLIDIKDYKIRSFNDKWTFTLDDKIYDGFDNVTNNLFKVTYTISSTGKNYYVNGKLIPAWQQAKLFVQYRLRSQIMGLINGVLQVDSQSACDATKNLSTIHSVSTPSTTTGVLKGFNTLRAGGRVWDIYNETISCETAEAEGSFSLTYTATIKKGSLNPAANAALHSYTKDINIATSDKIDATITVKGTVQGMVRGGFVYYDFNHFQLPQSGSFITAKDGSETKYDNARSHYNSMIGNNSDLLDTFKTKLNITKTELLINNDDEVKPKPASFTLEHGYHNGSVTYTAVYERQKAMSNSYGYTNMSIVRTDPTDIIQEFVVPGRGAGPIIQKLNMKTPRTITINIDGASKENKGCSLDDLCDSLPKFNIVGFDQLLQERDDLIITKQDYTSNKIDGSFSISLEYTAKGG